jgi:ribosomal protein L4
LWKEYIKVVDVLKAQQVDLREEALKELKRLTSDKK